MPIYNDGISELRGGIAGECENIKEDISYGPLTVTSLVDTGTLHVDGAATLASVVCEGTLQSAGKLTVDHIGEYTGSHNIVCDNVVQLVTGIVPDANDGAYLGTSALGFSDLFLASGAVIDFGNGNVTLTHSGSSALILSDGTHFEVDYIDEAEAAHGITFGHKVNMDHIGEATGSHNVVVDNVADLSAGFKAFGAEALKVWTYSHTITAGEITAGEVNITVTAVTLAKVRGIVMSYWKNADSRLFTQIGDYAGYLDKGYMTSTTNLFVSFTAGTAANDAIYVTIIEAI